MPPRPAVAIGSAQSAVSSAASSSLPLPSLSPSRLLFHRPLGLCPAPRRLGGAHKGPLWKRERTRSGNWGTGGWVPAQDWPRALREWMGTGEVSRGGVGKPHGRPLHTTAPPPSRSPRRVGVETCFQARGRGPRAQRSPASLRGELAGGGVGGSVHGGTMVLPRLPAARR